ncbi:MAG TPA: nucleotide exchange factor GrpE [Thermoanaerobaculia bacterium]|nr:nucleotide exchange factor GrpE [Thermoanaerobaculia bacterium]
MEPETPSQPVLPEPMEEGPSIELPPPAEPICTIYSSPSEPSLETGPPWSHLERRLEDGFETLERLFADKLAYDQFKEQQIDRLHAELQAHKGDLLLRAQQPLLRGLIRLHDDLGRLADALAERAGEELTRERFQSYLAGFRDDVETLLDQHGVTRFEAPGESFDGRRQLAARTCQTAEPALVGQLAERLRPGFELGDSLLQKERVAVFVAAPNQVQEPQGGSR